MCPFPLLLASLLLPFVPISLASECHPIINEFSVLRFTTTAKVQYFEFALNEGCSDKSHVNFNEYGLLVLNTKSRRARKPDHFNTITFVDFNNYKWPCNEGKLEKYFVVGSSAEETAPFNWNFYSNAEKLAKCSRFVNWPQCLVRPIDPKQRSVIDPFFASTISSLHGDKTPQTVVALVHLPNLNDARMFANYFSLILTSGSGNTVYRRHQLDVSTDNQMWLSNKIKHIVFSPTSDRNQMLPMDRLTELFGCPANIVAQHLPPEAINDVISVSLCGCRWALTMQSPGADNHCEGEKFKSLLTEISMPSHHPSRPCVADVRTESVDIYPTDSPDDDFQMDISDSHSEDRHISSTVPSEQVCRGQWDTIIPWMRTQDSKISDLARCVNEISSELRKRNILYEEGLQLGTEEKRRQFGLHRDSEERERLKKDLALLEIDGYKLSYKQREMLMNMAWVSYYRDSSRPNADFIRCKLCNREDGGYNPSADHDACDALDVEAERNERKRKQPGEGSRALDLNLLGEVMVDIRESLTSVSASAFELIEDIAAQHVFFVRSRRFDPAPAIRRMSTSHLARLAAGASELVRGVTLPVVFTRPICLGGDWTS
ncbi:unnamed protein product [Heligmosomoides polygyrus]|uniref:Sema domain-containing protein n=1 Tax=Heligmosomoides polygyrus TaxID=6339 RepID=A0A183FIG8_HELPZ|nr:unnamed protein product [Heligmosomoides polygyrus]